MKKIKLEYDLAVLLFAYLHQADLSLHKAGWTDIAELRNFYSDQVNPRKVVSLLISNTGIDADKVKYVYRVNEYGFK